jgi:predicted MFS family arabinose efflux permease
MSLTSTRVCDAMLPALAESFATSAADAAAAVSSYAIAYGVMQVFYGPLGDRFGKPRVIMLATGWCALSTACAAAAPTLQALVIARAAMGAGTAAIVPLSVAWIGDTVPLGERQQVLARFSGVTVFGLMIGPLLGGLFAQALSWRAAFVLLAVLFAGITCVLLAHSRAGRVAPPAPAPRERPQPYLRQVLALLADPWAQRVLAACCVEAGLGIGSLAFVPTVLHTRFGLSLLEGGAVTALFGLGGFAFSRSAAPLLRAVHASTLPALAGAALGTAFLLLAVMPHWSWAAVACAVGGFGFFMMHNTLQVQATQLSTTGTGVAVSVFTCSTFIGQSAGVVLGAIAFARLAPGWIFAGAAAGLLALGFALMRALRGRAIPVRPVRA